MTEKERENLKIQFREQMKKNDIKLYRLPEKGPYAEENKIANATIPFAVLGSKEFADTPQGQVRARSYSYGVIESNFFKLDAKVLFKSLFIRFVKQGKSK